MSTITLTSKPSSNEALAAQATSIKPPSPVYPSEPKPSPSPTNKLLTDEEQKKVLYDAPRIEDTDGPLTSNKSGTWETINFESAFELICTVDRHINAGTVVLHPWQIEVLKELSFCKPTSQKPYRFALCAANGSGKDAYVIAPFVIWFALTRVRSLTVITSSSGVQLTAQTETYIASMAHAINALFGEKIFKITKRFIKCLKSGSEIRMFATDEAGKAEGYHPLEPNAEMAIIVNEAKTVTPDIFGALERCTGYNYWLNISTPGEPYGDFFQSFTEWPHTRRVNAYDCPHLSLDDINHTKHKYGENSAIFRSKILALFTAIGGMVVINQDFLNRCVTRSNTGLIKWSKGKRKKLGIDFAAGRDECAFCAVDGNRQIDKEYFIERDTTETEVKCEAFMRKHGARSNLKDGEFYNSDGSVDIDKTYGLVDIFADDGGLGHAIIDRLVKKGYNITRVINQSRAYDTTQFGNHGAENWFNIARLIEECLFILDINLTDKEERKLYEQLAFRHYKKNETSGKITLESKEEARANGHVSPDRADALVLALSDTTIDEIEKAKRNGEKQVAGVTIQQLMESKWKVYAEHYNQSNQKVTPITGNSLEALFNSKGIH